MFIQYSFHTTSALMLRGLTPMQICDRFANMGGGWWCCINPMPS